MKRIECVFDPECGFHVTKYFQSLKIIEPFAEVICYCVEGTGNPLSFKKWKRRRSHGVEIQIKLK